MPFQAEMPLALFLVRLKTWTFEDHAKKISPERDPDNEIYYFSKSLGSLENRFFWVIKTYKAKIHAP